MLPCVGTPEVTAGSGNRSHGQVPYHCLIGDSFGLRKHCFSVAKVGNLVVVQHVGHITGSLLHDGGPLARIWGTGLTNYFSFHVCMCMCVLYPFHSGLL